MKTINRYITEKLKISKKTSYTLFPKDRDELVNIIVNEQKQNGKECDLNHIDTSKITDMSDLFYKSDFNGDISQWDVSNVVNMESMFMNTNYNGDLLNWNVSNVTNMRDMFLHSKFNGDISKWDVSNVINMNCMFGGSDFNQNISNWKINPNCDTEDMFIQCQILNKYKPYQNSKRI